MAGENEKNRRLRPGRLLAPGLLAIFCLWYGSLILELPQGPGEEGPLGPSFAPWVWLALLVVLVAVEIGTAGLRAAGGGAPSTGVRMGALDALAFCLLLVAFTIAMQYAGFYLAAGVFLCVALRWSGIRPWKLILPYAFVFAAAANYVFHHVLQVPLPQGWPF